MRFYGGDIFGASFGLRPGSTDGFLWNCLHKEILSRVTWDGRRKTKAKLFANSSREQTSKNSIVERPTHSASALTNLKFIFETIKSCGRRTDETLFTCLPESPIKMPSTVKRKIYRDVPHGVRDFPKNCVNSWRNSRVQSQEAVYGNLKTFFASLSLTLRWNFLSRSDLAKVSFHSF